MLDPRKNNVELATKIMADFEEMRDLYTIIEHDEHCPGGIHMVGQVHIIRHWKRMHKDVYGGTDVSIWLALSGNKPGGEQYEISIKDAQRVPDREEQNKGVGLLIAKHLSEFLNSERWSMESLRRPDGIYETTPVTEREWIDFLERGDLIVIKQTL